MRAIMKPKMTNWYRLTWLWGAWYWDFWTTISAIIGLPEEVSCKHQGSRDRLQLQALRKRNNWSGGGDCTSAHNRSVNTLSHIWHKHFFCRVHVRSGSPLSCNVKEVRYERHLLLLMLTHYVVWFSVAAKQRVIDSFNRHSLCLAKYV